jgi:hypothetical protein
MAFYRLLCTKSQIAAVSMGHWTVRIIMLVSTLLVGILIGLYYAGFKTSEVGIALSVCHKQSMQVLLTIYISVFVTRGRHFGARESV